ncbi:hypothetical protein BGZ65_010416, partial [Modicella reniformis]
MGNLSLDCLVVNGTRLLGLSYTSYGSSAPTHVVLIQSNPNPASIYDVSWSMVSAWSREFVFEESLARISCHVDPQTGVFTALSNHRVENPAPQITTTTLPSPGGFQYDPRNNAWQDFTLDPSYLWGDFARNTDALFNWPNSSTLYQANIAQSNYNGYVNLGMLVKADDGSMKFVNAGFWELDPVIHGYPIQLVAGHNAIYQFGVNVVDNRTGALQTILTKIPLTGMNGTDFRPPPGLPTYNVSDIRHCDREATTASFYRDTLAVLCKNSSYFNSRGGPVDSSSPSILSLFHDNNSFDALSSSIEPMLPSIGLDTYGDNFQAISAAAESKIWGFVGNPYPAGLSFEPDLNFDKRLSKTWSRIKRKLKKKIVEVLIKDDDEFKDQQQRDMENNPDDQRK